MSQIDTHYHVVPPEYARWLRATAALARDLPNPDWDPIGALALHHLSPLRGPAAWDSSMRLLNPVAPGPYRRCVGGVVDGRSAHP